MIQEATKADHVLLQNDDTLYPGLDPSAQHQNVHYVMDVVGTY